MDAGARALLRQLNTETCADPTTDAIRLAAYGPDQAAESRQLASNSPLVLGGLIERTDGESHASDHRQTWKVARRIVALAHGDLSVDPELFRFATPVQPDASRLGIGGHGLETDGVALPALIHALGSLEQRRGHLVVVQGPKGSGRRSLLFAAAAARGLELMEVDLRQLSTAPIQARRQLVALARECRLLSCTPLVRDLDAMTSTVGAESPAAAGGIPDRLAMLMQELDGLLVLATASAPISSGRLGKPVIVAPRPLTGAQLATLWHRALPMIPYEDADRLASMYPLAPALISATAEVALAQSSSEQPLELHHIRSGLRTVLDDRLSGFATRVDFHAAWEDLVLPAEQTAAIHELLGRARRRRTVYETWKLGAYFGRGLGISALFSGPPGTGKTMAAGLIADELGTDVYQVDLSKIVSKWIGETEKNLAALFDAAEAGHAILLFDEADALFGKRTEVKSSNDRHANHETNFLLQRLESFRGICILTTNHDLAIDEAFRRRLALHVSFPLPEVDERVRLWQTMLRDSIPTDGDLDLEALGARFEMSGGYIRNAVLRAAFYAADAGGAVTQRELFRAAQLEYQAMGRIAPAQL
jgi:hypothetical protein